MEQKSKSYKKEERVEMESYEKRRGKREGLALSFE
jgi:hypothetical protein